MVREIKKDFEFLKSDVLGIVLYGSHVREETTAKSDIDICIVAGYPATVNDMKKLLSKIWRNVNVNKKGYDVKIFEELPMRIKAEIIEHGKVVTGNKPEIYEYFYKFRKMWDDQKHRHGL